MDHAREKACAPLSGNGNNSQDSRCVSLIGMPGSGKSTLARELSGFLGWPWLDTDHLLEAWFGVGLETLKERLGREEFLRCEEELVLDLWVTRCIVATGGSVVYSDAAMRKLQNIGPVVYLQADPEVISSRVARFPERGLIMQPGQNLSQVHAERKPLYEAYADFTLDTSQNGPRDCAQYIARYLELA
ncbi:MAG: shikimate kinase [Desulfohalobiaceae bacterium]|nr:shikimate kinase [Desulfohalobiaceae bacterium]